MILSKLFLTKPLTVPHIRAQEPVPLEEVPDYLEHISDPIGAYNLMMCALGTCAPSFVEKDDESYDPRPIPFPPI